MPCLRHRSLADIPAACSFSTLMICSSVNLPLRIIRLLGGEQNPNLKPGAFQGSRSDRLPSVRSYAGEDSQQTSARWTGRGDETWKSIKKMEIKEADCGETNLVRTQW